MGLFDIFKKKTAPKKEVEKTLPPEAIRWNKLWDMWADGQIESPYQDFMTYQSEVNNGGHSQFFFNVENTGDVNAVVNENLSILPEVHKHNLEEAYLAYRKYNDADDNKMDEILDNCDHVFYENEELINEILEKRAETIEL